MTTWDAPVLWSPRGRPPGVTWPRDEESHRGICISIRSASTEGVVGGDNQSPTRNDGKVSHSLHRVFVAVAFE